MQSTMQLLYKALSQDDSAKFWCEQLQISRNTLATAKLRGRLSPTIAGNLARLLGEDIDKWIVIAALEAEPPTYGRRKLEQMVKALNSWVTFATRVASIPRARHRKHARRAMHA